MAVHPTLLAMLGRAQAAGIPPLSSGSPDDARLLFAASRPLLGAPAPIGARRQIDIPTRAGTIPALLLLPSTAPVGLGVYLHGGGWVIGAPIDYEILARAVVARSGCALLLPDYRLAPEHPFPAGLEDCEDAVLWAATQTDLLGSTGALALLGDSAGGNLAAVASARLHGRVRLAAQFLIYPVTDCDFDTASYRAYGQGLPLTRDDMRWFFGHYAPPARWSDAAIAPLQAAAAGLPPTTIVLAENDVLRTEGEAFAERLRAAGIPTQRRLYEGMTHGFLRYHNLIDVAAEAVRALADDLRRCCERDE